MSDPSSGGHSDDIAVIGMAGRFPGADGPESFWRNLRDGRETISSFTKRELREAGIDPSLVDDPGYIRARGVLSNIASWDAAFFNFSPRDAELLDPQQRIFLECAWEALEEAGYDSARFPGRIGIYAGATASSYWARNLQPGIDPRNPAAAFQVLISNDKDYLPTRVSFLLNLRGPSVGVQTACSSSLVAVHQACQSLLDLGCDIALAGGASISVPNPAGYLYQPEGIMSDDGHNRSFDARGKGSVFGDGVGVVVLKRLDDAIEDGDHVYAVIKGSAVNNDGSLKVGYTAPSVEAQAEVVAEALAVAQVDPATITYVEAHGSATPLGDPIEVTALTRAFRSRTERKGYCALGSVKSNLGHLYTASGVTSLIKTVLALRHRQIPPSLNFEVPNPAIDFADSPFHVATELQEWRSVDGVPRRAGVNSLGIGGTNAHVILEEAPEPEPSGPSRPWQILPLSARTATALETATANLAGHLRSDPSAGLADVAFTLQAGRRSFTHRRVALCRDTAEAAALLESLDAARVLSHVQEPGARPVVFLFGGLGDQYLGMGLGLYQGEPTFRAVVDRCAELLLPRLGVDLREVIYPGGTEARDESSEAGTSGKTDLRALLRRSGSGDDPRQQRLHRTAMAQPALFVLEYALATLWMEWGVRPQAMIGHSLGEYVAACVAGVLPLEDALILVAERARLIESLPHGAMLTVPLPEEELRALLGSRLSLAAVNGPANCVAAGPEDAIAELERALAERGVPASRPQTTHAFHSAMLEAAAEPLTRLAHTLRRQAPKIPYLSNVTGTWITAEQAIDPAYWARHMCGTVRFESGLRELVGDSARVLVEIGPGLSLGSFARQHPQCHADLVVQPSLRHSSLREPDGLFLLRTLGKLWLAGVEIDWQGFHAHERRRRASLPTYPFERQRYWIDLSSQPRLEAETVSRKKPDVADWFYRPAWREAPLPAPSAGEARTRWLLLTRPSSLAAGLAVRLRQTGHDVVTVSPGDRFAVLGPGAYAIRPGVEQDWGSLFSDLKRINRLPDRVVHLWSLSTAKEPTEERIEDQEQLGFYALLSLVQALGHRGASDPIHLAVVADGLQAVLDTDVVHPEKSPLLGLSRVIPQELPDLSCRAVDVALPGDGEPLDLFHDVLIAELSSAAAEPLVALRGARRWAEAFTPVRPEEDAPARLREGGVYLITGGLGGVGLILAERFARLGARLALVGRSELPPRLSEIQALEEAGAEVLVLRADVGDPAQMRGAVARCVERFGALHGVVHAAGLPGREWLVSVQRLERDVCEAHFRAKVRGTLALAEALRGRDLDFVYLMSSIGTVLGGLWFGAYAGANAFLDAFASERARQGEPWLAVDWDGWPTRERTREEEAGLGASAAEFEMTREEAAEAFVRSLSLASGGRFVVSTGSLEDRLEMWQRPKAAQPRRDEVRQPARAANLYTRPNLAAAYVPAGSDLERRIAGTWQRILGLSQVGVHDNFFDLGGNSLVGVQVLSDLREELGIQIPTVTLFESPTVSALARVLGEQLGHQGEQNEPEPVRPAEIVFEGAGGQEIAIIGMAGRFPGARNVEELWRNLCEEREALTTLSDEDLLAGGASPEDLAKPNFNKIRPILADADLFDAGLFGYNPREATLMDPQQRNFLECAWQALEDAGYDSMQYGGAIGAFAGVSLSTYLLSIYGDAELWSSLDAFQTVVGNEKDTLTTAVSYKLDLRGPSLAVQTHCSTSLVAVHLACQSLLSGESSMALAGGASIRIPQKVGYLYTQGGQDSVDGHTRPFDACATGTVFGDGVGLVVLKRLRDAVADGDRIYAVIKGSAVTNDGSLKVGFSAPSVEGQARAAEAALVRAGVDPSTVSYVEAHGSATPVGDPIEVAALTRAFRKSTREKGFCGLGSVKSNVGHLDRAAGVTGLIKTALSLHHKTLVRSLNFEAPNPELDLPNSPFYVVDRTGPWERHNGAPRRAGVNSPGMGGTNAHAILEEAPEPAPSGSSRPWQLLLLSARTATALDTATAQLAGHLRSNPDVDLADAAFTAKVGRRTLEHRRAVVCRDRDDAAAVLESLDPKRVVTFIQKQANRRVAFLFPGVGDHYANMGLGLYRSEPTFRQELELCAEILRPHLGIDLLSLIYPGGQEPEEEEGGKLDLKRMLGRSTPADAVGNPELNRTVYAQPAVFAIEYALAQLWREWGIRPESLIGYSLGEYVAACLAGVLSLEDALRLVAERARLIEELPAGAMLAVPLPEDEARKRLGGELSVAVLNGPHLTVLSGPVEAVAGLESELAAEGVSCRRLPTTHAFHSAMMEPVAGRFREIVASVRLEAPRVPFVSNVTGTWAKAGEVTDPEYWVRHLCGTVRFSDGAGLLLGDPERILLEVGPGQSLSALVKQQPACDGERGQLVFPTLRNAFERRPDPAFLLSTLGKLWAVGVKPDWKGFYAHERRRRVALPTYPFERQRYWLEGKGHTPTARLAVSSPSWQDGKKEPDIAKWFFVPVWKQIAPLQAAVPAPDPEAPQAPWLLFLDDYGVGEALAARLERAGLPVVVVRQGGVYERTGERSFAFDRALRDPYSRLMRDLGQIWGLPRRIVHCGAVAPPDADQGLDGLDRSLDRGFFSLLFLAQALGEEDSRHRFRIDAISSNAHQVLGDEELCPERVLIQGPTKIMAQEYQNLSCRLIDMALTRTNGLWSERVIDQLLRELAGPPTSGPADAVVALRGLHRWGPAYDQVRFEREAPQRPRLREHGVYLLTGGLGGIALGLAEYLAREWHARLVLVNRTPLPARSTWPAHLDGADEKDIAARRIRRVLELEALGAEVLVLGADVADRDGMRRAVGEALERFGEIHGVLHTAGVPGVGIMQLKTPHQVAGVLASKVHGTMVLDEVLRDVPLDFLVLFSSVTAITGGGPGQVDYGAANAFLSSFARSRTRPDRPVFSIEWGEWQWDAWQEGLLGFDPELRAFFQSHRRKMGMTFDEGADVLVRVLSRDLPHVAVSAEGLQVLLDLAVRLSDPEFLLEMRGGGKTAGGAQVAFPRPVLGCAYVEPRNDAESALAELWQELLGLEAVGVHDNFFELGGHSLLATQIFSRLRPMFGLDLPLRLIFEAPTVAEFAEQVAAARGMGEEAEEQPGIVRIPRIPDMPLSSAQQRLWFLDQLDPGNPFYNVFNAVRMTGEIDVPTLAASLREIVRRHEVLRTTLTEIAGRPVARILEDVALAIPIVDLGGLPQSGREAEGLRLGRIFHGLSFDLGTGPQLRFLMVRLAPEESLFFLILHHVVADDWSMGIFLKEIVALYGAFTAGRPSPLPELPVQYADYAAWQQQYLDGPAVAAQLAYWKERLAGELPLLKLPGDRPRPAAQSHRGASCFTAFPGLGDRLRELAQQRGATLFMVLLAGFDALLLRYTGQSDLLVGSPIANRNRAETEGLLGFFVNTLVMRADLSEEPTFARALEQVREVTLGAYANQDLPFERLVEALRPERTLDRSPLFQVMLTLQNAAMSGWNAGGLLLEPLRLDSGTAKFDLELMADDRDASLPIWIEYATDLFDGTTIDRFAEHFRVLLEGIAETPEAGLFDLPLLTAAERRQLAEWNRSERDVPLTGGFVELFEQRVAEAPEAIAVTCSDRSLTYAELEGHANRWAWALIRRGVGTDSVVGLLAERGIDFLAAVLAVLKAGAAYLPLDPLHPAPRLNRVLERSGTRLVLCGPGFGDPLAQAIRESTSPAWNGNRPVVVALAQLASAENSAAAPPRHGAPGDLAYVIFTSGSTGTPKGAMIEQRGMVNHLFAKIEDLGLDGRDVIAQTAPQVFDISVWQLLAALAVGGRVHVVAGEAAQDPRLLLAELERGGVTIAETVPSLLRALLDEAQADAAAAQPLARLRWMIPTGEALPPKLCREWLALFPRVPLLNAYGPTECSDDVAHHALCQPPPVEAVNMPIGRPVINMRLHVVDRAGGAAPVGVPGELLVAGVGVGRGYLNDPTRTAEVFVPDGWSGEAGGRLYRTGDLARRLAGGELEFLGRIDHQVKLRGFRIELGEIEAALAEHPAVEQAVVLLREGPSGEAHLAAYVAADGAVAGEELRGWLRGRLPDYMVPAACAVLASLPLTANGKIDRRALLRIEVDGADSVEAYVAPRTATEEALAALWSEILGLEKVGVRDSFFVLGGHSLQATRLASRLRGTFGVDLPLRAIFEHPSLEALAKVVDDARYTGVELRLPPIALAPRDRLLELSFAQQRLWFLCQLDPQSPLYDNFTHLRLTGRLDVAALARVFSEISRRHEVLRTTYPWFEGRPVQSIAPAAPLPLPLVDLSGLAPARREAELPRVAQGDVRRPSDLARGPLLRVYLLRLDGGDDHAVLIGAHHILTDAWSEDVLVREMSALYEAFAAGRPSPLPELPVQYADFAVWQREWLSGDRLEEQLSAWQRRLAGAPALLELPTDRPRPSVLSHRGATRRFSLPPQLSSRLREVGESAGATLFMTLLGALQALLSRYSGQEDIVVGSPIANRTHRELEDLVGFFVNTLALRTDLTGDPVFRELLGRVREITLDAYAHQDLPFERLLDGLRLERNLGHSPIFQVLLAVQNAPTPELQLGDLTVRALDLDGGIARFELVVLVIDEGEQGLSCQIDYSTDLFEEATLARMEGHLGTLLAGAVGDPERRLSELPLLAMAERRQVLEEWSCGPAPLPAAFELTPCLHSLFEDRAARDPKAVAMVCESETMTYGELDRRADHLAHHLRCLEVGPEVRVGVCLERSVELVVAILATLKAGGAYVPLDPSYPVERLRYLLEDSGAGVLLTRGDLRARLPETAATVVALEELAVPDGWAQPVAALSSSDNAAYVIYTSGSTGRPKGVVVTHANVVRLFTATESWFGFGERDVWTLFHSYAFDFSVWEIWGALLHGGRLVVVPYLVSRSPEMFLELLRAERVTVLNQTPSAFQQLVAADGAVEPEVDPALRLVIFGGEALELQSLEPWFRRHGDEHPRLINMYGITETTVHVTYRPILHADLRRGAGSVVGVPIPDLRLYILDRWGQIVPAGVPGEIHVGGNGLARVYLGRPELTAERFVPDPFGTLPGNRLYRSGDLARHRADGDLEYLGRIDHQVKIRGFRIELGEIESAIAEQPEVRQVVVLARNDANGAWLVAYVVSAPGATASGVELRRAIGHRLPDHMIPAAWVVMPELPLTSNGKVDRRALPEPELAAEQSKEWSAPRSPLEELLAAGFAETLGRERVSVGDNFFETGGDSIRAAILVNRLQERLAARLPVAALFQAPTVEGLAAWIEERDSAAAGWTIPVLPRGHEAELPLSFGQQRMWFVDRANAGLGIYNTPVAVRMNGRLDLAGMAWVLAQVVRRHEVLRATFHEAGGIPVQRVAPPAPVGLPLIDLSGLAAAERHRESSRLAAEEAERPFDLERGPLLRCLALRLEPELHDVVCNLHHIVSDAWTGRVLVREVATLYRDHLEGRPVSLPALPIQYADFAAWQRDWLQGEVLEGELQYWQHQLRGNLPLLELPADRPRPAQPTFRGERLEIPLPEPLCDALRAFSRRRGTTLFMSLLAGFAALLFRKTRESDVVLGCAVAGRNRPETEDLIGLFINMLVLRLDLTGNPTFGELLDRVREMVVGAFAHQDLPFDRLVEHLRLGRGADNPLFRMAFGLDNVPDRKLDLPDLELQELRFEREPARFDLTLWMVEEGDRLTASWLYSLDLFQAATVTRLHEQYVALLSGAVADPDSKLARLGLRGKKEEREPEKKNLPISRRRKPAAGSSSDEAV